MGLRWQRGQQDRPSGSLSMWKNRLLRRAGLYRVCWGTASFQDRPDRWCTERWIPRRPACAGRFEMPAGFQLVAQDGPLDLSGVASGKQELWLMQLPNALVRIGDSGTLPTSRWLTWSTVLGPSHRNEQELNGPPSAAHVASEVHAAQQHEQPTSHALRIEMLRCVHAICMQAILPLQAAGTINVTDGQGPCLAAFQDPRDSEGRRHNGSHPWGMLAASCRPAVSVRACKASVAFPCHNTYVQQCQDLFHGQCLLCTCMPALSRTILTSPPVRSRRGP